MSSPEDILATRSRLAKAELDRDRFLAVKLPERSATRDQVPMRNANRFAKESDERARHYIPGGRVFPGGVPV